MLKGIVKKTSDYLQKPIRNIYYSIPDYIRYGKVFREKYKFLNQSQYWSKKQLEEYQMLQLEKLLKHAYETVPYYRKIFNERGLKPKNIQNFNDLKQLPYLTKDIIKNNLDDLISKKYDRKNITYVTTGGSTGIPMGFYINKFYDTPNEWAYVAAMWNRIGYDIKKINRCVILRGNIPKNGYYEYKNRDLILSSFKLTEENMDKYINLIEKFNPDFIQAYPSSIFILAKYINENCRNLEIKNLKAIICGSENLYDFQRKEIENAFNIRVYSFYGHTEHACIGGECEKSNFYHLQSEYGYTELINDNRQDVTKEDEVGEIVATGFNNYVVPFIRYKTCDMAVNTNEKCKCGREYRLIKRIDGRKQELIVTKTRSKIMLTGSYKILDSIKKYIEIGQFYQEKEGILELRLVKKEAYNNKCTEIIKQKIKNKFGGQLDLKIVFVSKISRTKRGKYKYLIQKLNVE